MKIIGRTLIILAAALIVVGAAYAIAQTDLATPLLSGGRGFPGETRPERGKRPEFRDGNFASQLPEGFDSGEFLRGGDRHDGRSRDLFSFLSIGRHLLIMGVIILAIIIVDRLLAWRKRRIRVAK